MLKTTMLVLGFGFLTLTLNSCASYESKKELATKEVTTEKVSSGAELRKTVDQLIATAPDLTDAQKKSLNELFKASRVKAEAMRDERLKLKSILIKDVLAEKYNSSEVKLIKQKLSKLSKNNLALTFKTIDQVNLIMGHTAKNHPEIIDETFNIHRSPELD